MTDETRQPAPIDPLVKWGEQKNLEGGDKNPFDDPYGPTSDCLSSNDVVRMFRLGAETRVSDHLAVCGACMDRITNFAAVTAEEPVHEREAVPAWRRFFMPQTAPEPAPAFMPAMVHVSSICAVDGSSVAEPLRVEILTDDYEAVRGMQVWLGGCLEGSAGLVHVEEGRFPWLEISGVKVSRQVETGIQHHHRITDRLEISVGPSRDSPRLVGHSNVAFTGIKTEPLG